MKSRRAPARSAETWSILEGRTSEGTQSRGEQVAEQHNNQHRNRIDQNKYHQMRADMMSERVLSPVVVVVGRLECGGCCNDTSCPSERLPKTRTKSCITSSIGRKTTIKNKNANKNRRTVLINVIARLMLALISMSAVCASPDAGRDETVVEGE